MEKRNIVRDLLDGGLITLEKEDVVIMLAVALAPSPLLPTT